MNSLVKRMAIALVFLIIVFCGVGLLLPADYRVERSVEITASPKSIHTYVGDLNQWDTWTPWKDSDPSIVVTLGDKTTGVGASQSWTGGQGGGSVLFTKSIAAEGLEYDLVFGTESDASSAKFIYSTLETGTKVDWVMEGKIATPIIGGYFALLMDSFVGPMFESGLSKLKTVVENG